MTGGPVWAFIIGAGLFSVLVTAFGGLRTVVWTDAWQVKAFPRSKLVYW